MHQKDSFSENFFQIAVLLMQLSTTVQARRPCYFLELLEPPSVR
jgi:hypothetical protein